MAFKGIDFAKHLWDEYKIKYGPEGSYSPYPRQYTISGFRENEMGGRVVKLKFSLDNSYKYPVVKIEEGGVTGYEDYAADIIFKDRWKQGSAKFYMCAGCGRYDSLYVMKNVYEKMVLKMMKDFNLKGRDV